MEFPLHIVDAFTLNNCPFSGNPAAVCILESDDDISDEIKQKIASEMNLSETAFVAKKWIKNSKREENSYTLRWFTPRTEVQLCGHATLASARVLFDTHLKHLEKNSNKIQFKTKFRGTLEAVVNPSEETITLDFPISVSEKLGLNSMPWVEEIVKSISNQTVDVNHIIDIQYSSAIKYLLLRLTDGTESGNLISKISPDFKRLLTIDTNNSLIGVIVTQKPEKGTRINFFARFFAPWAGVDEDPVCGSAYTVLMPYWSQRYEENGLKTNQMVCEQCSQRRGTVVCNLVADRVQISGKTRVFVSGILNV